jgi:hypothetical protein
VDKTARLTVERSKGLTGDQNGSSRSMFCKLKWPDRAFFWRPRETSVFSLELHAMLTNRC